MESCHDKIRTIIRAVGLIAGISFLAVACNGTQKEPYRLSAYDKALLSSGDIIMRRGEEVISTFILNTLNETVNISHCGIIVREGEDISVIHCLSDKVSPVNGVQRNTIDEFTSESIRGTITVVRCKADTSHILADGALYYLKKKKKFDHKFDYADTTEFFCSELPMHILSDRLGIDLMKHQKQFSFSLFFNLQHFEPILTHDTLLQNDHFAQHTYIKEDTCLHQ